jgi:hypothetical protein
VRISLPHPVFIFVHDSREAGWREMITIVMYHYVRELASSRYPEIKGLELSLFREQLTYIQRHYQVIAAIELMDAARDGRMNLLPDNSLLLTFDDGLADHYKYVFPLLQHLRLQGSFFPPAMPIQEEKVLDVHKVHFILATVKDKSRLVDEIFDYLNRKRDGWPLKSNTYYYENLAKAWRYDCAQVMFIKRMLQTVLPLELRSDVADYLFRKYVSDDERAFAVELFMSRDQLRIMVEGGCTSGTIHIRTSG